MKALVVSRPIQPEEGPCIGAFSVIVNFNLRDGFVSSCSPHPAVSSQEGVMGTSRVPAQEISRYRSRTLVWTSVMDTQTAGGVLLLGNNISKYSKYFMASCIVDINMHEFHPFTSLDAVQSRGEKME